MHAFYMHHTSHIYGAASLSVQVKDSPYLIESRFVNYIRKAKPGKSNPSQTYSPNVFSDSSRISNPSVFAPVSLFLRSMWLSGLSCPSYGFGSPSS
jgi:hypothetical protein